VHDRSKAKVNRLAWRTPGIAVVCGGLILMVALGTRQTFGLFLRPMSMDLAWGREVFSFAIALQNLVWGLAMPFAGAIADRYGSGKVLVGGAIAYGVGLVAMAHATTPLAFHLSAGLLVGLGLSGTGFGVVLAVVARAYPPEKRSLAVGITAACGSFGQFGMLPLGQLTITAFGWAGALIAMGVLAFAMVPLSAALSGANAAAKESDQSMRAALREAGAHSGFLLATAAFFVCGFQTIFIMTHLPAYLVDGGLTPQQGMIALATVGLFNIVGSYACGQLGGRYSKKMILVWIYVVRAVAIGVFVALPVTVTSAYLFSAVMGITWLGTVPLTNALVGQIFGAKYLSTLFSICFLGHQLGAFAGSWAAGSAFDLAGSYQPVWLASIALSVLAALLCLPIDERTIVRPVLGRAA
jgi:MFS family permease